MCRLSPRWPACFAALALLACSSDPPEITLEIVVGHESDALTRDPPVVRIDVSVRSVVSDFESAASAAPGGSFDLGELPSDEIFSIEATGVDAANAVVVRGRSLSGVSFLSGPDRVPLFVQRLDAWARPPDGIERAHLGAPAAPFAERFVMSSGGEEAEGSSGAAPPDEVEFYDLLFYRRALSEPLPRVPKTLVTRGSAVLLLGGGSATWIDFASGYSEPAVAPAGLGSFADVEGGAVIEAEEGVSFVVGATRESSATPAVLRIDADGALAAVPLAAARAGAAAGWVPGVGLVVAGGSADAAGVEVLAPAGSAFVARDFPTDPTRGAGASARDGRLLLVGGSVDDGTGPVTAPTRILDPACAARCMPEPLADAEPPALLTRASAWSTAGGNVIVVAEDEAMEQTRLFLLDAAGTLTERPLREPRAGATATPAPNGTLMLLGGRHPDGTPALAVEMLFAE